MPTDPSSPAQRRWAYVILALALPALVLEIVLAARTDAATGFLQRYSRIGLPLALACLALLMLLPPRHKLLAWLWAGWVVGFGFWAVGFVALLIGRA